MRRDRRTRERLSSHDAQLPIVLGVIVLASGNSPAYAVVFLSRTPSSEKVTDLVLCQAYKVRVTIVRKAGVKLSALRKIKSLESRHSIL